MTIDEFKSEIERLEMDLAKTTAGMKNLYGRDYQEAEMELIKIKGLINQVRVLMEVAQYKAVS